MAERLYLTHSFRGDDGCPACGQFVVWRKIGDRKWVPCDKTPVMCYRSPYGRERVVKHGELLEDVVIVRRWNAGKAIGKKWFYALEPHTFTCPALPKNQKIRR